MSQVVIFVPLLIVLFIVLVSLLWRRGASMWTRTLVAHGLLLVYFASEWSFALTATRRCLVPLHTASKLERSCSAFCTYARFRWLHTSHTDRMDARTQPRNAPR